MAALTVGQDTIFKDLQQDVEYIRVCLLDLIEQDNRVRMTANLLGKLAAFIVANVSRRRTDHTRNGVFLHIFGHINAEHGAFVIEQKLGQRLAQFGFADAGRTEEQERTNRLPMV